MLSMFETEIENAMNFNLLLKGEFSNLNCALACELSWTGIYEGNKIRFFETGKNPGIFSIFKKRAKLKKIVKAVKLNYKITKSEFSVTCLCFSIFPYLFFNGLI